MTEKDSEMLDKKERPKSSHELTMEAITEQEFQEEMGSAKEEIDHNAAEALEENQTSVGSAQEKIIEEGGDPKEIADIGNISEEDIRRAQARAKFQITKLSEQDINKLVRDNMGVEVFEREVEDEKGLKTLEPLPDQEYSREDLILDRAKYLNDVINEAEKILEVEASKSEAGQDNQDKSIFERAKAVYKIIVNPKSKIEKKGVLLELLEKMEKVVEEKLEEKKIADKKDPTKTGPKRRRVVEIRDPELTVEQKKEQQEVAIHREEAEAKINLASDTNELTDILFSLEKLYTKDGFTYDTREFVTRLHQQEANIREGKPYKLDGIPELCGLRSKAKEVFEALLKDLASKSPEEPEDEGVDLDKEWDERMKQKEESRRKPEGQVENDIASPGEESEEPEEDLDKAWEDEMQRRKKERAKQKEAKEKYDSVLTPEEAQALFADSQTIESIIDKLGFFERIETGEVSAKGQRMFYKADQIAKRLKEVQKKIKNKVKFKYSDLSPVPLKWGLRRKVWDLLPEKQKIGKAPFLEEEEKEELTKGLVEEKEQESKLESEQESSIKGTREIMENIRSVNSIDELTGELRQIGIRTMDDEEIDFNLWAEKVSITAKIIRDNNEKFNDACLTITRKLGIRKKFIEIMKKEIGGEPGEAQEQSDINLENISGDSIETGEEETGEKAEEGEQEPSIVNLNEGDYDHEDDLGEEVAETGSEGLYTEGEAQTGEIQTVEEELQEETTETTSTKEDEEISETEVESDEKESKWKKIKGFFKKKENKAMGGKLIKKIATIFTGAGASIVGVKSFYDVPYWALERAGVVGSGKDKKKFKELMGSLGREDIGEEDAREKRIGEIIDLKKVGEIEDKIDSMDIPEKEKDNLLEELNKLIENFHSERTALENNTNKKLRGTLDNWIAAKVSTVQVAKETMNTALVAGGALQYRLIGYALMDLAGRFDKMIKQTKREGKDIKTMKLLNDVFVRGTVEMRQALSFQGEGTGWQKALRFVGASGKLARYAGFTYGAFNNQEKFLDQFSHDKFDKIVDTLTLDEGWKSIGKNFVTNLERLPLINKNIEKLPLINKLYEEGGGTNVIEELTKGLSGAQKDEFESLLKWREGLETKGYNTSQLNDEALIGVVKTNPRIDKFVEVTEKRLGLETQESDAPESVFGNNETSSIEQAGGVEPSGQGQEYQPPERDPFDKTNVIAPQQEEALGLDFELKKPLDGDMFGALQKLKANNENLYNLIKEDGKFHWREINLANDETIPPVLRQELLQTSNYEMIGADHNILRKIDLSKITDEQLLDLKDSLDDPGQLAGTVEGIRKLNFIAENITEGDATRAKELFNQIKGQAMNDEQILMFSKTKDLLDKSLLSGQIDFEEMLNLSKKPGFAGDMGELQNILKNPNIVGAGRNVDVLKNIMDNYSKTGDLEGAIGTIGEGEGFEHAARRLIEANPEKFNFQNMEDWIKDNPEKNGADYWKELKDYSAGEAHKIAEQGGFVKVIDQDHLEEVRFNQADTHAIKINPEYTEAGGSAEEIVGPPAPGAEQAPEAPETVPELKGAEVEVYELKETPGGAQYEMVMDAKDGMTEAGKELGEALKEGGVSYEAVRDFAVEREVAAIGKMITEKQLSVGGDFIKKLYSSVPEMFDGDFSPRDEMFVRSLTQNEQMMQAPNLSSMYKIFQRATDVQNASTVFEQYDMVKDLNTKQSDLLELYEAPEGKAVAAANELLDTKNGVKSVDMREGDLTIECRKTIGPKPLIIFDHERQQVRGIRKGLIPLGIFKKEMVQPLTDEGMAKIAKFTLRKRVE